MKISLGTDHAGFKLKEKVKLLLESLGHEVVDFGTFSEETVDYPVFVRPAAEAVARGECERVDQVGPHTRPIQIIEGGGAHPWGQPIP